MKVVALISGGKDSTYNMLQCIAAGHEVVALANLSPVGRTEIDSYMYQSVGHEAIDLIAEAMELPLFKVETGGVSKNRERDYEFTEQDEVEDLYELLERVRSEIDVEAVSCGAILSDYQRTRVENVCIRLNLVSLAYLWQRDQEELLQDMIKCEIDAIVVKVAALGLEPQRHLGRSIRLLEPHFTAMHEKYGLNVCGEGGEYETLTLDCPLYKSRISVDESELVLESDDGIASVGYMKLNKLSLQLKLPQLDLAARLNGLPLKDSDGYITDTAEDDTEEDPEDELTESNTLTDDLIDNGEINQSVNVLKSGYGWLHMGGLSIHSEQNPRDAFEKVMAKLKSCLEENNHRLQNVCSITMYVADMSQYAQLNELYVETLNHVNPPTRACVQVPLPPNCPVILEAISWTNSNSPIGDGNVERRTMHVQSISHWCPANIGPYSQTIKIGEFVHLAGQIGLIPGSMKLIEKGVRAQCRLSLRHVERLLKGIDSNSSLRDVVQGVCYLTSQKYISHARKFWEEKTNNAIVDYVVVSGLPRNALVEWHVWAHTHNQQFEYEETGQCLQEWSISIFRRWNYENDIAAIVCHVNDAEPTAILSTPIFRETMEYVLQKLNQGHDYDPTSICNLKIFFPITKRVCAFSFVSVLEEFRKTVPLVYTIVPVVSLHSDSTFLSICGLNLPTETCTEMLDKQEAILKQRIGKVDRLQYTSKEPVLICII